MRIRLSPLEESSTQRYFSCITCNRGKQTLSTQCTRKTGKMCNRTMPCWPQDTTPYTHQYPNHIPARSPFIFTHFIMTDHIYHLLMSNDRLLTLPIS